MQNKPMKLDLSDFFVDERKCSLILLDGSWRNIKDLQDHIQNLFHLTGISLLTGDGSYLPPKESVEVLRNADSLKAFIFSSPIDEQTVVEVASTKKLSKKRKNPSPELDLASSTPNNPKRSKNILNQISSIIPITDDLPPQPESKKKRSKRQNGNTKVRSDSEKEADSREGIVTNKEDSLKTIINEKDDNSDQESISVSKQSALNQNETIEEEQEALEEPIPQPLEVIFHCALMKLVPETPRIFKLPRLEPTFKILENILIPANVPPPQEVPEIKPIREAVDKPEIENQTLDAKTESNSNDSKAVPEEEPPEEEGTTDNVVLNSDSEDEIMVLDDSDSDVQPVAPVRSSKKSETADVISNLLQTGVCLTSLPTKGDTLVFKLPKARGSKILGQTEFIAGTCLYVNRRTKTITISMISYPKYLFHVLRQYKSNLNDSVEDDPVLHVNMKDLIEPIVCVSTID